MTDSDEGECITAVMTKDEARPTYDMSIHTNPDATVSMAGAREHPFDIIDDGRGRCGVWNRSTKDWIIPQIWRHDKAADILAYLVAGYRCGRTHPAITPERVERAARAIADCPYWGLKTSTEIAAAALKAAFGGEERRRIAQR